MDPVKRKKKNIGRQNKSDNFFFSFKNVFFGKICDVLPCSLYKMMGGDWRWGCGKK